MDELITIKIKPDDYMKLQMYLTLISTGTRINEQGQEVAAALSERIAQLNPGICTD
jgi:hypothetical protein